MPICPTTKGPPICSTTFLVGWKSWNLPNCLTNKSTKNPWHQFMGLCGPFYLQFLHQFTHNFIHSEVRWDTPGPSLEFLLHWILMEHCRLLMFLSKSLEKVLGNMNSFQNTFSSHPFLQVPLTRTKRVKDLNPIFKDELKHRNMYFFLHLKNTWTWYLFIERFVLRYLISSFLFFEKYL